MSERAAYLKAAESLRGNPGQWAAYESNGHCVVLAGPGSGKTKTLTLKLARMLAENIEEPRGIACITYNTECARELEQRLDSLGIAPNERIFIGTVHSFSLTQIILPYAKVAKLGLPENFEVASQQEQRGALERAYNRIIGQGEDPQREWRLRMENYRRSHLNRNAAAFHGDDPLCASLVLAYEKELRIQGYIDFDDMPLLALRALVANKWLREAIRAKYPILAVDEYQDLGKALHRMVIGLCFKTGIRLFAVGDVDQSIYGFTGANPELLKKLSQHDEVETVQLRLNYRCGKSIVTASQYALGEDRDYEAPAGAVEGTIYFQPLQGNYEQHAHHVFETLIPDAIKRLPGLEPGNIAILYPAAWIGNYIADAAKEYGYDIVRSDGNALYPRSSHLMRWLEQCATWCCSGWQTGSPRFSKLIADSGRLFAETLVPVAAQNSFQRHLITFLQERRDSTLNLYTWLKTFRHELLQGHLTQSRTLSDERNTLDTFINKTAPGNIYDDFTLGLFCGHGEGNNRINLTTLHSSKGREFRLVVLFGMDDGKLPRNNAGNLEIQEARRLFYVGFTRAEEEIYILYSNYNPSPFVLELAARVAEADET